ncbi:hypothetical protein E2C01_002545 [Portunus trituberculatus]|uniref:Uncharacterized protein n=1 Tax=Portunus trituberculatus TaxID=210409 RepID=A0A5B7CL17_PORTR|nr:hypothetical protein [Portunus trituberculatus]
MEPVYEIRAKGKRQGLRDKVEEGDEMKKGGPGWRWTVADCGRVTSPFHLNGVGCSAPPTETKVSI